MLHKHSSMDRHACVHALHLFWCVSWVDLPALWVYCVAGWQTGNAVGLRDAQKASTCSTWKHAK